MAYDKTLFAYWNSGAIKARRAYDEEQAQPEKKRPKPNENRRAGQRLAPCGTFSAYKRHTKYDEPIDDACSAACNAQSAVRRADGRR